MSIILKSGTSANLADVDATPKALRVILYDSAGSPVAAGSTAQGNANANAAQAWTMRLSDGAAFYNTLAAGQLPAALVGGRLDVHLGASGITLPVSAAALPLPTGAATEATLATRLAEATFTGRINTLGQKAMAASTPVVIASDQSALTVTGTVTATNPSVGANNAAVPGSSTQVGGSDGTNLQAARVYDADTGAGSEYALGVVLRKRASGGSVEAGTAADPLRVDPTGTTTQPVSAATLPLPAGAATEATLATRLADATFTTRINTLGQKAMAASTPVVLASDQSAIPVTQSGAWTVAATQSGVWAVTQSGAWTVTANVGTTGGLALDATLTGGTAKAIVRGGAKGATAAADVTSTAEGADHQALDVQVYHGGVAVDPTAIRALTATDVVTAAQGTGAAAAGAWAARLSDGTVFYVGTQQGQLPAALVGGRLDTNVGAWLGSTAPTVGQKAMAASLPVVLASDQSSVPVTVSAALPAGTNRIGRVELNAPTTAQLASVSVSVAASGDNTLVAGAGGQTVRVFKLMLVVGAAVNIRFKDGAGTNLTGIMTMTASGAVVLDFDSEPWFVTALGNGFVLNLSAAVQVSGRVYYTQS